ncbi:FecR family protein [Chitinophaga costaii]|uniref:FecR family protein n=1 Tax=Chitinophaga costaii TaxID=1335309 RepID=A0A1C4FY19_9BACT|nr:FecR family protein [Chitinophaga costaii]SCC60840.1 FecR family protein [Chitinophaga costaii]
MAEEDFSTFNMELLALVAPVLQKQLRGEMLSGEEWLLLEEWKNRSAANAALAERLENPAAVQDMLKTWHDIEKNRELNKQRGISKIKALAFDTINTNPAMRPLPRRLLRYAAAIIFLLGTGAFWWTFHKNNNQELGGNKPPGTAIIGPGHNGAILTLADGSKVVLDSMGNGVVATQYGAKVSLYNGQLAYDPVNSSATGSLIYNTVTTPKGREFRLQLPDGSKVWLNAASTVRYPTTFTDKERRVELEGEAYFEVAKNASRPFIVKLNDATAVEVLGTSFNINAYKNETAIKTTLLEGAVRLQAYQQVQTLTPGQQASISLARQQMKVISNVDIDHVMAWKNGLFDFNDASLEEVMRQLERWYDIEVIYEKGIPAIRFGGEINKKNSLQDVLQILESSNVHYRLEEGRKLVVVP